MVRIKPEITESLKGNTKGLDHLAKLEKLLTELERRDIPVNVENYINQQVGKVNSTNGSESKKIQEAYSKILQFIEKKLKLVPKDYYASTWMTLGMSAFGLPIGVVFFASTDNPAFIALGLPIGLGIGSFYGATLDKKAKEEGRVLDLEV